MYVRYKSTSFYQLGLLTYFVYQKYVNIFYIYKSNFLPHLILHFVTGIEIAHNFIQWACMLWHRFW